MKINHKRVGTHRFSWILHNGDIPDKLHVLHRCDVRACVNPAHLFIGTARDNILDAISKGRYGFQVRRNDRLARGERHGQSKLNDQSVLAIRILRSERVPRAMLATAFSVDINTIANIERRKTWVHV